MTNKILGLFQAYKHQLYKYSRLIKSLAGTNLLCCRKDQLTHLKNFHTMENIYFGVHRCSTKFTKLCCCTTVQATTNATFRVTEVTPAAVYKRTFFLESGRKSSLPYFSPCISCSLESFMIDEYLSLQILLAHR